MRCLVLPAILRWNWLWPAEPLAMDTEWGGPCHMLNPKADASRSTLAISLTPYPARAPGSLLPCSAACRTAAPWEALPAPFLHTRRFAGHTLE